MKLSFILISSFLLLLISTSNRGRFERRAPLPLIKEQYSYFLEKFTPQRKGHVAMLIALVLGDKRWISVNFKRKLSSLALNHLFTPSGLHLTAVLVCFLPLFKIFKKRRRVVELIFLLFLTLGLYLLPELYSLKRMAFFRLTTHFLRPIRVSSFSIFLLVFGIDLCFGTYHDSPLSFALSYLFLGIILSLINAPLAKVTFALGLGQVLVAYFFHRPVYPIAIILNFFFSFSFSYIYPFIFVFFIIHWITPLEFITLFFEKFILWSYEISLITDPLIPTFPFMVAWTILLVRGDYWRGKTKKVALILFLSIHAPSLNDNYPRRFLKNPQKIFHLKLKKEQKLITKKLSKPIDNIRDLGEDKIF